MRRARERKKRDCVIVIVRSSGIPMLSPSVEKIKSAKKMPRRFDVAGGAG